MWQSDEGLWKIVLIFIFYKPNFVLNIIKIHLQEINTSMKRFVQLNASWIKHFVNKMQFCLT